MGIENAGRLTQRVHWIGRRDPSTTITREEYSQRARICDGSPKKNKSIKREDRGGGSNKKTNAEGQASKE